MTNESEEPTGSDPDLPEEGFADPDKMLEEAGASYGGDSEGLMLNLQNEQLGLPPDTTTDEATRIVGGGEVDEADMRARQARELLGVPPETTDDEIISVALGDITIKELREKYKK